MSNKILLFCLICGLTCSLTAQSYRASRRNRNRRGTQNVSVEQTKTKESNRKKADSSPVMTPSNQNSSNKPAAKFDPKKPVLTQNYIDSVMNGQIRKKLLECKIPAKLPGNKSDDEENAEEGEKTEGGEKPEKFVFMSRLDFSILMSQYKSLMADFELTEVSHIPLDWYQKYDAELRKFGLLVKDMTIAIRTRSDRRYAAAVQKFKAQQEACLKFLKKRPPRISSSEYEALVKKNTKIRQQNYLKKLREEREAAMKRRQEQLKQLQQKNQPKNQQNQKPTQGGVK